MIATKWSTEFIKKLSHIISSNVVLPNVSKLRDLLSQELCDVTLYLSHKSLHQKMYNLFDENEENRKKFDEIKKLLRSLSQAVKLIQVIHNLKESYLSLFLSFFFFTSFISFFLPSFFLFCLNPFLNHLLVALSLWSRVIAVIAQNYYCTSILKYIDGYQRLDS